MGRGAGGAGGGGICCRGEGLHDPRITALGMLAPLATPLVPPQDGEWKGKRASDFAHDWKTRWLISWKCVGGEAHWPAGPTPALLGACARVVVPPPPPCVPATDTQTDEVNALRKVAQFVPEVPDDETVACESEVRWTRLATQCAIARGCECGLNTLFARPHPHPHPCSPRRRTSSPLHRQKRKRPRGRARVPSQGPRPGPQPEPSPPPPRSRGARSPRAAERPPPPTVPPMAPVVGIQHTRTTCQYLQKLVTRGAYTKGGREA